MPFSKIKFFAFFDISVFISFSFKAFIVYFNIKSTICNNWSFVKGSNEIISSILFKNSGLNTSFKLSIILSLSTVLLPNPIELVFRFDPAFDVIIIIVFEKLTVFP